MLRGLLQVACPFLGCYMLLPILSQDPAGCPQVSCWSPLCFWIRSTSCQTMSEWLRHFDESNPCGRSKWRQRNDNCTFHWQMASFAVVQVVWDSMVVIIPLNNIKHLIRTYSSSADFQLRACYGMVLSPAQLCKVRSLTLPVELLGPVYWTLVK